MKLSDENEAVAIFQSKHLSQDEKLKAFDKLAGEKYPGSGSACPKCGTVSFSTHIIYERGEPNRYGYADIYQRYVFTNCGHIDESRPTFSTHSIFVGRLY
jgi:hypothetical protein